MNGTQERLRCEFVPSVIVPTLTGTRCKNGGCTREIYRGAFCFRCWAGTKWLAMHQRVENKNGNTPSYVKVPLEISKEELIQWVFDNPPPTDMKWPSIDRIVPEVGYTIKNIRWLEFHKNSAGPQRDIPDGFYLCKACQRTLPLTDEFFYGNKSRKWGKPFQASCKECHNEYRRNWKRKKRISI